MESLFKKMMQLVYEDGINELKKIDAPVENYIEIYEREYKE